MSLFRRRVGWVLADAVEKHAAAPDTFRIPSDDAVASVQVGDRVKLIFEPSTGLAERMWVTVTDVGEDGARGEPRQRPCGAAGAARGRPGAVRAPERRRDQPARAGLTAGVLYVEPVSRPRTASVVGGGPAGLIAAEVLARAGVAVTVYDRMPSPARKFLLAGHGGLNLTHSEDRDGFLARYGGSADRLAPMLDVFGPDDLRDWCAGLGEQTFVGSSGRVFPRSFRATPLVRAWLSRLADLGVRIERRTRWTGWTDEGLRLTAVDGQETEVGGRRDGLRARRCVMAEARLRRRMGRPVRRPWCDGGAAATGERRDARRLD